jgi:hypothetical protein
MEVASMISCRNGVGGLTPEMTDLCAAIAVELHIPTRRPDATCHIVHHVHHVSRQGTLAQINRRGNKSQTSACQRTMESGGAADMQASQTVAGASSAARYALNLTTPTKITTIGDDRGPQT